MRLTKDVAFRRLTVVLAAMTIAGCTGNAGTATPVGTPSAHHTAVAPRTAIAGSPTLSVRLVMPPTIVSGSAVTARLTIDNRTGQAIPVSDCGGQIFQVLLENQSYQPQPAWLACLTMDSIPPGVSVRQTRVRASANVCGASTPGLLPCTSRGTPPALPPGTYHTHVFAVSPRLPSGLEVTVQVLPAR